MSGSAKKHLIVIAGPTAIGKTALSIDLAKEYNCPILSYDSRQFYTEMSIGTAKPSEEELGQAEHHFINSHSIHNLYTSGMFETEALNCLETLFKTNDIVIAVGGSGLYINALCYGIDDIPTDRELREVIQQEWQTKGLEYLQKEVELFDPEYFEKADMQNPRRVMRAIEVIRLTGKPFTFFRKKTKKTRFFDTTWIGLEEETQVLYERINTRVDQMFTAGLEQEVKELLKLKHLKALQSVGYQEVFPYLDGVYDKEKAIELVKRNSRRYAKRQLGWFRRNEEIYWFHPTNRNDIIALINKRTKCI
jgi:tRNA dimethylallyltransferase